MEPILPSIPTATVGTMKYLPTFNCAKAFSQRPSVEVLGTSPPRASGGAMFIGGDITMRFEKPSASSVPASEPN